MKAAALSFTSRIRRSRGDCRSPLTLVLCLITVLATAAPTWWTQQSLLTPDASKDDYTAINIGQLKHTAKKAAQAIEAQHGAGTMGPEIQAMISAWDAALTDEVIGDDQMGVNAGMLKNVVAPFYDRLRALGNDPARFPYAYPWSVVRKSGGGTSSGSDVLNIASTTGLEAGMLVHGPGIPAGTTLSQFMSTSQIRLSAAATGTASGLLIAFARPGVGQRREDVTLTAGSDVLSTGNTTGLAEGMMVVGPGLPAATRLLSISQAGEVKLSEPSPLTLTGTSCFFYAMDDHAMVNLGQLKHVFSFGVGPFPAPSSTTALLTRVGPSTQSRFPQIPSDALAVRLTRSGVAVQGAVVTYRIYNTPQRGYLVSAAGVASTGGILTVTSDSDGAAFVYFVGTSAGGSASIECFSNQSGTSKQYFSVNVQAPPAAQTNPGTNFVNQGGGSSGDLFSSARNNDESEAQFGPSNVLFDPFGLVIQSGYAYQERYKKQPKRVLGSGGMIARDQYSFGLDYLQHSLITFGQAGGANPFSSGNGQMQQRTYLIARADSSNTNFSWNAYNWWPGSQILGVTSSVRGSLTFTIDEKGNRSISRDGAGDGIQVNNDLTVSITPAKATAGKAYSIYLLPVEIATDLNNDGQTNSSDSGLAGGAYTSGASDDAKDKATEFMFANDQLSNGAWDKEDTTTPGVPGTADDDDAEEIMIKPGITEGEVWLDHPAIAGMKFYKTRKCTEEIQLSPSSHFTISSSNPFPAKVFMRAESVTFPTTDPQKDGDLKLMIKPTGGAAAGVEAAKMKLTVVKTFGAKKFFHAANDYIFENNTRLYACRKDYSANQHANLCVLREEATIMRALDTFNHTPKLVGVDAVSARYPGANVIINGNMTFDKVAEGSRYLTKRCHGRLVSGSVYNTATSSDNDNENDPLIDNPLNRVRGSALAGDTAKYIAMVADHQFEFKKGRVPVAAGTPKEALGGLSTNYAADNPRPFVGEAPISETQNMIFTVTPDIATSGITGSVVDDAKKSGVEALPGGGAGELKLLMLDGGSSNALAYITPNNTHHIPVKGTKHTGDRNDLIPYYDYCIHTYLMFQATPPRQ